MKKKELKREIDSLKENFEQMAKENQILKEEILKLNKEIDDVKVFKNNSIKFYKNFLENPNLSCLERNDILSLININTPHDILSFTFCENFEKKSVFKADLEKEQINAQKLLLEKKYPGTFHRDKNEFDFIMVKFKDENLYQEHYTSWLQLMASHQSYQLQLMNSWMISSYSILDIKNTAR
jgi:hypothetical protein